MVEVYYSDSCKSTYCSYMLFGNKLVSLKCTSILSAHVGEQHISDNINTNGNLRTPKRSKIRAKLGKDIDLVSKLFCERCSLIASFIFVEQPKPK